MVGSQCISTSYSCGAKEQGEMQKSFDVPHFMGNSSRTKSSFTYQRKGNDENHERNCSKSGSSRTSEQKNRGQNDLGLKRKLVIGKRNQHKGNECLFAFSQSSLSMAASSTTSKRLLLAFLFSSWVCASVCSASDPRHHSFSVEVRKSKSFMIFDSVFYCFSMGLESIVAHRLRTWSAFEHFVTWHVISADSLFPLRF